MAPPDNFWCLCIGNGVVDEVLADSFGVGVVGAVVEAGIDDELAAAGRVVLCEVVESGVVAYTDRRLMP